MSGQTCARKNCSTKVRASIALLHAFTRVSVKHWTLRLFFYTVAFACPSKSWSSLSSVSFFYFPWWQKSLFARVARSALSLAATKCDSNGSHREGRRKIAIEFPIVDCCIFLHCYSMLFSLFIYSFIRCIRLFMDLLTCWTRNFLWFYWMRFFSGRQPLANSMACITRKTSIASCIQTNYFGGNLPQTPRFQPPSVKLEHT